MPRAVAGPQALSVQPLKAIALKANWRTLDGVELAVL